MTLFPALGFAPHNFLPAQRLAVPPEPCGESTLTCGAGASLPTHV